MVDELRSSYRAYCFAYVRKDVGEEVSSAALTSAVLGFLDARAERPLRTIADVEAEVRRLGGDPGADVAAMTRELEQAREALEHARRLVDELTERDREVRALLEADPIESTQTAARRIVDMVPDMGPTARDERERQAAADRLRRLILADGQTDTGGRWLYDAAADEIVRLRAEIDRSALKAQRLRGIVVGAEELRRQDGAALAHLRAEAAKAREQGAAEMRERAAAWCDGLATLERFGAPRRALQMAAGSIRGLRLDGAPKAQPEGLSAEDAATLRAEGYEVRTDGMWGHYWASETIDPRTPDGLAELRRRAQEIRSTGLSAVDAERLRGAGWTEVEPGCWMRGADKTAVSAGPRWRTSRGTDLEILRNQARQERERQTPAVAHMGPGKATGEESETAGSSSVAEEQGAAQGAHDGGTEKSEAVPAPEAGPARAEDPSEPTARDAVAGMLLRHRRMLVAEGLVKSMYPPGDVAQRIRDTAPDGVIDQGRAACIAALEALARGELHGARDYSGIAAVNQRMRRERDEARAEAKALREERANDIRVGPDDDVLFDDSSRVHLVVTKGADAREVLATVADLLGLTIDGPIDPPAPGQPPEELERLAGVHDARGEHRHSLILRSYAAGIREGERRAAEQIPDLMRRTHDDGIVEGERRARADAPVEASDREALGRAVHDLWAARGEGAEHWEHRTEQSRELLRAAGERLFAMGARHGRASAEAQPEDMSAVRAAIQREAEAFQEYGRSDELSARDASYLRTAAAMVTSAREARLALAVIGYHDQAINRVLDGPPGGEVVTREADGATSPEREGALSVAGCASPVSPKGRDTADHAGEEPTDRQGSRGPSPAATPEAQARAEVAGHLMGTLWRLRGAPTQGAYEVVEHAIGRVRVQAQHGDACASMHEAELRSLWEQVDGSPITPPVKRYAAPGQDGGDVPADPRGYCPEHGAPDTYDQCTRCVAARFPREVERRVAPVDADTAGRLAGVPCASCGKSTSTGCCFACTVAGRCGKAAPEPAKPAAVLPRQRWRCVGIDGELEVWPADSLTAPGEVPLFPIGSGGTHGRVRARTVDMLGLPQWTFVGAPRE